MINVLPEIYSALNSIAPAHKGYPKDFKDLPCISFYEQQNSDALPVLPNRLSEVVIQVDIWHKKSTGDLARQVNDTLSNKGLIREFAAEVQQTDINHMTMRFRGVVNEKTQLVTQ